MQATITYLLTEQAQRAQMAATGRPVALKQTTVEEVPNELIASPLASIGEDGVVTFTLARDWGVSKEGDVNYYSSYGYGTVRGGFDSPPPSGVAAIEIIAQRISAYAAEIRARHAQAAAVTAERERKDAEEKAAAREQRRAVVQQLIDAFWADPAARAAAVDSKPSYWVDFRDANGKVQRAGKDDFGVDVIAALGDAAHRRNDADKAAKEAATAAKEAAKAEYIAAWIAEHGTPSQKARQADNLLCRDEAITALADATFGDEPACRYTSDLRPRINCADDECEDCEVKHTVTNGVDCLSGRQHEIYSVIRAAYPGATYVLRTHTAVHDCDHNDDCKAGENYSCLVKITVGPFILQREYAL